MDGRGRPSAHGRRPAKRASERSTRALPVDLRLGSGVTLAVLLVGVADEQSLDLTQEIAGAERFDEDRVGIFARPIVSILLSGEKFTDLMFIELAALRRRIGGK